MVEFDQKLLQFTKLCGLPHFFTPTFQYFYTDISAISVTFRNSADDDDDETNDEDEDGNYDDSNNDDDDDGVPESNVTPHPVCQENLHTD